MNATERMSKIHIWIGNTSKNEEEYEAYFELDYSTEGDFDDPDYRICPFCKDINQEWYDEDFIGILPLFEKPQPVKDLLKEIPIDENEINKILIICDNLGIQEGNAIFYLTDGEIVIPKPYKSDYNGLKYIGEFNSSLV